MGGGDLLNLLIERDVFEEDFTRFYVAEVRKSNVFLLCLHTHSFPTHAPPYHRTEHLAPTTLHIPRWCWQSNHVTSWDSFIEI